MVAEPPCIFTRMYNDNPADTEVLQKLRTLVQDMPSIRMSRSLRIVLFGYLKQQQAGLDVEFDTTIMDVETLFDLLDLLAEINADNLKQNSI
jgi:hypothetical protein